MARIAQPLAKWRSALIIGSAAMLLVVPSAAWAGSGHGHGDRHRDCNQRGSYFAHAGNHHGSNGNYHASNGNNHKHHNHGKSKRQRKHDVDFYCGPCHRHFSARDELYVHVELQHHVPFRHLSGAISFSVFGWIFLG